MILSNTEKGENHMKISKNKATLIATILMLSLAASMILSPTKAQVTFPAGTQIPTYAYINVAPNPIGVGQTVNVNFYLATVLEDSSGPTKHDSQNHRSNWQRLKQKVPTQATLLEVHSLILFQTKLAIGPSRCFYGGQTTGSAGMFGGGYAGLIEMPSQSKVYTLTVQQEPITQSSYPITPLPTQYWETPVSAQNVQNWYKIMGPWLGLGSITFASNWSIQC